MVVRYYSSTSVPTTLSLNVTPASTVIDVNALVGYPTSFPYTLCLDFDTALRELVEVTNAAGTSLTVTRGIDGTSAIAHSAGATVRHVSSARDFADSRAHENASVGVHGITGAVVGTTDTQTLTNKTLTSPTISNPTITGTIPTLSLSNPNITGTVTGGATYAGVTLDTNSTLDSVDFTGVSTMTGSVDTLKATPSAAPGVQVLAPLGYAQRALQYKVNGVDVTFVDADGSLTTGKPSSYHTLFGNAEVTGNLLVDGTLNSGAITSTGAVNATSVVSSGPVSGTTGTFSGAVSGTTGTFSGAVTASNITTGAWFAYVPTWTSTGTQPTLGTGGTITGRYWKVGKMVTANILITVGTGFNPGTGVYIWSLPSTPRTPFSVGGTVSLQNGSGADAGSVIIRSGIAASVLAIAPGGTSNWSGTSVSYAANSTWSLMITYEEA